MDCPNCGKETKMFVDVTMLIPSSMEHLLSKKNIAKKECEIWGVGWEFACYSCECGWSMSLNSKAYKKQQAEIDDIRTAVRNCFGKSPASCDGVILVATDKYNALVKVLNKGE